MHMNTMGVTNRSWGVCGFTSSFYAMHVLNVPKRPLLQKAGHAARVLAEIKIFLMMLKAEGKQTLLLETEKFTRTFGGDFSRFTIDAYISRINAAVTKTEQEILKDPNYGIAVPPEGVADYLRRVWGFDSEVRIVAGGDGETGDGIIGVTSHTKPMYDGLEHYMYRHNGKIYSWGEQFGSVAEAAAWGTNGADWRVCRLISVKPK